MIFHILWFLEVLVQLVLCSDLCVIFVKKRGDIRRGNPICAYVKEGKREKKRAESERVEPVKCIHPLPLLDSINTNQIKLLSTSFNTYAQPKQIRIICSRGLVSK